MRLLAILLTLICCAAAHTAEVNGVRTWPAPDHTRVVLDLDRPVDYKVFSLDDPYRVVLDIKKSQFKTSLPRPKRNDKVLKRVRVGIQDGADLRVVLDVHQATNVKSFLLEPNEQYGDRLVIDLASARSKPAKDPAPSLPYQPPRDVVIAIDAGHGGEDPGATGPGGVREKNVVFAVSRKLASLINKQQGMRAILTRDGDYYIGLRNRMDKAREHKADLFVSIHADAFHDPRVQGSSVYVLSEKGASSEAARWLADRENAADFIGGVPLRDKDDVLKSVLLDLSQTAAMDASNKAARQVLRALQGVGRVHKRRVQYAGFAVLKSPDTPSILVETAFISNPNEERRLSSSKHQRELSTAIMEGIRGYFSENPPPGTLLAMHN